MTLEEHIAKLNSLAFWREFTFAQNKFWPQPGQALELADNFVWLGDHAYILQLKQRENPTHDPVAERTWFEKKVLGKATRQVRDSLRFLTEHNRIAIINERGDKFDIETSKLRSVTKLVVFLAGNALPETCWQTRFHVSQSAGFIHVVAAHDYLGITEKLRVPEDIRRYFEYREEVVPKLRHAGVVVDESDIMGAFLHNDDLPTPKSRQRLHAFIQDLNEFDLSSLLADLHQHLELTNNPYEYYQIMLEFARVPRSVWREVKRRLMKSLEAVREKKFTLPFRLTFPASDCTFMIAPLDPDIPSTGADGEKARVAGLQNLTYGAKYDAKTAKGIGILVSGDGEFVQIDWALLSFPWEFDPQMEEMLATTNPFRQVKEKSIDSYFFLSAAKES